ncbi:nucleotidyltransferase family protein [Amylibacter sp.]|nr:nucleotidyltransferase family protein [Amylibacter sp.]MDC1243086.1 nucleotidyltransferase family protein [Amylibacter sp.]
MRALLLAAGLGTRLRPLTNTMPKCLVTIKDQVLLGIWLDRLVQAGVESFLINTHHLSNQVETYVEGNPYSDKVTLVHEKKLLGTAGTLIANLNFFEKQDGLLVHADNYCLANFHDFIQAHNQRPPYCVMTMMTFRSETPDTCGIVELDAEGVVVGFHEKVINPPGNLANGAVYILSPELIQKLATDLHEVSDFSTEVLQHLVGKIYTYETQEYFIDIGTPETYGKANSN